MRGSNCIRVTILTTNKVISCKPQLVSTHKSVRMSGKQKYCRLKQWLPNGAHRPMGDREGLGLGVAPGIFRRGLTHPTRGLKFGFQGAINAKNLRTTCFPPSDGGLACSDGMGYSPLALPWRHPWLGGAQKTFSQVIKKSLELKNTRLFYTKVVFK